MIGAKTNYEALSSNSKTLKADIFEKREREVRFILKRKWRFVVDFKTT